MLEPLKGQKMTNQQRTFRKLLVAAAVSMSLAAITYTANAAVSVQIGVPGIVVDANDPYYYSTSYCAGCWYGEWGGRTGYHRGGGRPWERPHSEADHHGRESARGVQHEGHH
jgi:hypothetical protein